MEPTAASPGPDDAEVIAAATALGRLAQARGQRLACAESCTGGLIAGALTETAGSSAWFDCGFVTYSNEAKADLVGVRPATLAAHGAVSEATAAEMARGALARSRAGLALAVTGIAGPTGAVPGKPVGTVCFGWALADGTVRTATRRFEGPRAVVRRAAALYALHEAAALLAQEAGPSAEPKD
jgi:nicotinamide-nucleotide amidase